MSAANEKRNVQVTLRQPFQGQRAHIFMTSQTNEEKEFYWIIQGEIDRSILIENIKKKETNEESERERRRYIERRRRRNKQLI